MIDDFIAEVNDSDYSEGAKKWLADAANAAWAEFPKTVAQQIWLNIMHDYTGKEFDKNEIKEIYSGYNFDDAQWDEIFAYFDSKIQKQEQAADQDIVNDLGAAGEFAEEFISEYADVALQRVTGVNENAEYSFRQALYAGAVGAVSGGLTTGVVGVVNNAHNATRGDRVIKNGNADMLVSEARFVADRLAGEGVDFENAQGWISSLRGQVDAYNALSPDAKQGLRGKTILGEMQASLYFAETQANVALVEKKIDAKSLEEKETLAAYINDMTGKKYTAADIDKNTDGLRSTLAVLDYASGLLDMDAAMAENAAVDNKIAMEQGRSPMANEVAQSAEGAIPSGNVENSGEFTHNPIHPAGAAAVLSRDRKGKTAESVSEGKASNSDVGNDGVFATPAGAVPSDMRSAENVQSDTIQGEAIAAGETKYDIVNLQDGKTYVKASRNVISGDNVSEWRKQISNFFTDLLDGEQSMDISTIEGDVLTITKNETARKARDRYRQADGKKQKLSDAEFKVKLTAESHIDEIAEVSTKNKNNAADTKKHTFAKDGFNYRTAYFQDFDGQYYQVTLSVGNNDGQATIYNVGKIKEDKLPSANIIAVVGSKTPRSLSSNNSIPQKSDLSTQNDKKDLAEKVAKIAQERTDGVQNAERRVQSEAQNTANEDNIDGASSSTASGPPSPALGKAKEADVAERRARAEERARKWAEWQKDTKPTAKELNAAREYVRGFDSLENHRRLAIIRMIRSAEGKVDEKTLRGVANLMAMRKKNGQSIAPDLEFRFVEGISDKGLYTHVGDKVLVLVNTDAEYKDTMRSTIVHELVHYIENKEGYGELAEFAKDNATAEHIAEIEKEYIERYEQENKAYTQADLDSEVVARLVGEQLGNEKFLARYAKKDDKLIKKLGRFLKGIVSAQKDEAELSEIAGKMTEMFDKALGQESVGKNNSKTMFDVSPEKIKEWEKPITLQDVQVLRTIGRKSINEFTSQEIEIAQKWAYKFYKELGVKSPFFRAWFGEWREHQTNKSIRITGGKTETYAAGKAHNVDMDMDISWGRELKGETINHLVREKKSEVALENVREIIENAVYFDTVVSMPTSKTKMPNTAFMHSFYTLYRSKDGGVHLLKVYVEEALSNNEKVIFKRGYELKDIIKVADLPNSVLSKSGGLTDGTSTTTYSIADLYDFVKTYDKDFKPAPEVSKYVLNDDGTPRVFYHGTEGQFDTFSYGKIGESTGVGILGEGFYFTDKKKLAKNYGSEVKACYLQMSNPYLASADEGYRLNTEKLIQQGYDGVILAAPQGSIYMVFENTQIKSATQNIGTFDKGNADTRYDLAPKKKNVEAKEKTAEKGEQKTDDVKKLRKMSEEIAKEKAKLSREQKAKVYTKQEIGVALDSIEALTDIEVLRLADGKQLASLTRERREELASQIYVALHNASAEGESGRGSVVVKGIATTIAQDIIDHERIVDQDGKSYHFKDVYDAASLSRIVQDTAQELYESFSVMGTETSNAGFRAAVRAVRENINKEYANDRRIARESRTIRPKCLVVIRRLLLSTKVDFHFRRNRL